MIDHPLAGVYVAAVTPLKSDYSPDLDAIPELMAFYARRGCHGALILGTTGEGPSFNTAERKAIFRAALAVRQEYPDFRLMAGTGSPSLEESKDLNKFAFEAGFNTVVVLPPYYFRAASEEGLFEWFSEVMRASVPGDGLLLGYHFPRVSGVPLSVSLLGRLRDAFPKQFGGLKDSSGDLANAQAMAAELDDRLVLVGSDRLLSPALNSGASGCITALANLVSPELRQIWDAIKNGEDAAPIQAKVDAARAVLEKYQPAAVSLKALLAGLHGFPEWALKPPLIPFEDAVIAQAVEEMRAVL